MPQAASFTSPRFGTVWLLALTLAFVARAVAAEEFTSVYTSLDLARCKDTTPAEMKDYGTVWRCKGHDGIEVRVAEGDLRVFVSYGPKAETQTAASETLPQFNTIGETLEWRLKRDGVRLKPFATILRFSWSVDGRRGSALVVTKLAADDACHVAYIEASGNPRANELARRIADRDAATFRCRTDKARTYGKTRN